MHSGGKVPSPFDWSLGRSLSPILHCAIAFMFKLWAAIARMKATPSEHRTLSKLLAVTSFVDSSSKQLSFTQNSSKERTSQGSDRAKYLRLKCDRPIFPRTCIKVVMLRFFILVYKPSVRCMDSINSSTSSSS